ncbi:hypothetical protein PHYPSEUDO_008087 [Phytophthora pseudosyringae]|uniref:Uncharacterized protein n=1 Tax=Phytophthora pseudosyringae TaxID=221518 RepID=A0A8T1VI07_9STRA|nr:hypothetical protein PHYPSEUDO_008087 [Phytophthora pseudosyringae]
MAPKPTSALPPCGNLVVYLGLRPDVLAALQAEATSEAKAGEYIPVFKEVGGVHDDAYREQAREESVRCCRGLEDCTEVDHRLPEPAVGAFGILFHEVFQEVRSRKVNRTIRAK